MIYWPTLSGTYGMLWRAPVDIEPCIEGGKEGGRKSGREGGREGGKTDQVWNIYSIVVEEEWKFLELTSCNCWHEK